VFRHLHEHRQLARVPNPWRRLSADDRADHARRFFASNLITKGLLSAVEATLERLPFVRLLYGSTRDLLNAFVGEKRRFDKPVLVAPIPESGIRVLGFLTQESLAVIGLREYVTVYVPQSYGFAGQLIVVRRPSLRASRRKRGCDGVHYFRRRYADA